MCAWRQRASHTSKDQENKEDYAVWRKCYPLAPYKTLFRGNYKLTRDVLTDDVTRIPSRSQIPGDINRGPDVRSGSRILIIGRNK